MNLSLIGGLTEAEVARRVAEGKSNAVPERAARSVAEIVRANVFTRINAILGVLLMIVLATGSVIGRPAPTAAAMAWLTRKTCRAPARWALL